MGKRSLTTIALLACAAIAGAQGRLGIEDCHAKARARHPLARQYALIDRTRVLDLALARRGYLPRLSLAGKTSLQSDVTTMYGKELAPKDQYTALAELAQTVWDGGAIAAQVDAIESASLIDSRKLDVDLYALNDRVDQLFFGIMAIRAQLEQNAILSADLEASAERALAGLRNGVMSASDVDAIRVEILNARQKAIELAATEKAHREALAALIGEPIAEDAELVLPGADEPEPAVAGATAMTTPAGRPEVALFAAQAAQCEAQKAAVLASKRPRLVAFAQGAYGKPGLDMLDSEAASYWIAGLRLSWSLNGLLDTKDELARLDARASSIAAQKEAFVLNNEIQIERIQADIEKYRGLLGGDGEIIALREGMRKAIDAKVENGTATAEDLVKAIGAVDLARQGKALHEVQLAASLYALKNATNE